MSSSDWETRYCPVCVKEISVVNKNGNLMSKKHYEDLHSCGDLKCVRAVRKKEKKAKKVESDNILHLMNAPLKMGMKSIIHGLAYKVGLHGFIYRQTSMNEWVRAEMDKEEFCRGVKQ
jgi:hypothetical protein